MTDEYWEKIRKALEDPKYKWRTIGGITKETGLDIVSVKHRLASHPDLVVKSSLPSTAGEELYTTREHYKQKSSLWERFESAVTNKVQK